MNLTRRSGTAETGFVPLHGAAATWLIASFLAVAVWIAFGVYAALDGDSRGNYCDFSVAATDANFTVAGEPCRIMIGPILAIYGPIFVWVLLALQSPAFVFYLVRIWKIFVVRRETPEGADASAPQIDVEDMGRKARPVRATPGQRALSRRGRVFRGLVHAYLAATFIVLFNWAGMGAWVALDMNKDARFCDYRAEPGAANFQIGGDMCRLRVGNILGVYGTTFLIVLAGVQSPAYLYFAVWHFRRRRSSDRQGASRSAA